jgi:hypothetical protein
VLQEDQDHLSAVDPSYLLQDQRRAYDIIDWHLAETLQVAGRAPPQLLMLIPGEGGVGKIEDYPDNHGELLQQRSWSHTYQGCIHRDSSITY